MSSDYRSYFPTLISLLEHFPSAESKLLFAGWCSPSQSDVNFLFGFLDGLHCSSYLNDDYYMSCLAELQTYEINVLA